MHEHRKCLACCDQCCRAVCLSGTSELSRAEGTVEFGSALQFADICSSLPESSTESTCSTTTKFDARLVSELPLTASARLQHCRVVGVRVMSDCKCWAWGDEFLGCPQMCCAEGPALSSITSGNTHQLLEVPWVGSQV